MGNYNMTEIQSKVLNVFLAVKKICHDHNLTYFAIGGTCLGAARHNGFIPWDDDLDIAIPGDDYKKFYEIAKRELPSTMKVEYTADLKSNPCLFMKVYDVTTTFVEKSEINHPDDYNGIFIDIMPLYGIPKNTHKFKQYSFIIKILLKLNRKMRITFSESMELYEFRGKMLWLLICPLNLFFKKIYSYKYWSDMWEKVASKYDFKNSIFVGYTWCNIEENLIFPKQWFDDYVELPFESTTVRCPINWENYLTHQFGDYMKPPPETERINHSDGAIIDCNKAFTYYQEKYLENKNKEK